MQAAPPSLEVVSGAVVFTDIVGFTEYTAVRGDAEAFELLSTQERIVTGLLPEGARIVKELGDGLLLWFADPAAAIETTLAMQEQFEAAANDTGMPLWVRVGAHWGQPVRRRDDIVGHDVNVASRIVDVAGPGEVLVSEALVSACSQLPPGIDLFELGPVVMKGLPDAVRLYRATRLP